MSLFLQAQCTKKQCFAMVFITCLALTTIDLALWSKKLYFYTDQLQSDQLQHTSSHTFKYHDIRHVTHTNVTDQQYVHYKAWSKGIVTEITPSIQQNCSKLINADDKETNRVTQLLQGSSTFYIDANYSNCDEIQHEFYGNFYVSDTEKTFPLAFALVVHTNIQQVLRFLKVIYRSHNLYCIHPDPSSGELFMGTFKLLSRCLPNVFVSSQVQDVKYLTPNTIFAAQMSCFQELEIHPHVKWKYAINLCSRELPLQTNRFIVECLREMDGISIVHISDTQKAMFEKNFSNRGNITHLGDNKHFLTPLRLNLHKSKAYNALSRSFVRHLFHNHTMQQLHQWLAGNCRTPEEFFYASAFMNPGTPGGYYWTQSMAVRKRSISIRMIEVHWIHSKTSEQEPEICLGKTVHHVCIMNSAELPWINRAMKWGCWFFNKYFMENDHIVMDCVEETLVRKNMQEYASDHQIQ